MIHEKWGEGVVLTVSGARRTEATITFSDVGEKRVLLAYAPLRKSAELSRRGGDLALAAPGPTPSRRSSPKRMAGLLDVQREQVESAPRAPSRAAQDLVVTPAGPRVGLAIARP